MSQQDLGVASRAVALRQAGDRLLLPGLKVIIPARTAPPADRPDVLDNRLNQHVEFALHRLIQTVERQVDAVVGHAALREVIGAIAVAAVAAAQQVAARGGFRLLTFGHFGGADARAQHRQRLGFVLC